MENNYFMDKKLCREKPIQEKNSCWDYFMFLALVLYGINIYNE